MAEADMPTKETDMTFNEDITERAARNPHFREVLSTGPHSQVVVMMIPSGGEIGEETHEDVDQILVFTAGEGVAILNGERSRVSAGRLLHVPAGTRHNIVSAGQGDLRLYTMYAPPEHAAGTVHHTRADAEAAEVVSRA
jgi:mannose-6-phosphate isomerase-like protein (cupin superfamily)